MHNTTRPRPLLERAIALIIPCVVLMKLME
jgi:hypothetical protein